MSFLLQRVLLNTIRSCAQSIGNRSSTNRCSIVTGQLLTGHLFKFKQNQHYRLIMSQVKPKVVFVLGAPGSGKGTQCAKIVNDFGYVHLSAGDMVRAERSRPGSELGEMIESYIKRGQSIPVAIPCSLIEKAMNEQMTADSSKHKFLVDGFPRNQDNLDGWNEKMADKVNLSFVLFFECPDSVCIDRCLCRDTGRVDDNLDSLKKRFEVFHNNSLPIIDYYDRLHLVRRVNGEPPADLVFENVRQAFSDYDAK